MPRRSNIVGINAELEKAITAELKEIVKKGPDGKFLYSLVDRARVYDRALKLEAIKQKLDDPGFGAGFTDDDKED